MIKTILVAASGNAADAENFAAALAIARQFAAHLDVLHVRSDPVSVAVAMTSDVGAGAMTSGLLQQLESDAREREAKARENFARLCTDAGIAKTTAPRRNTKKPSAQFHVESGEEPAWIVRYGVAADLIVAPRGTGEALARTTLEAALLETGRPILIPGAKVPEEFARIAIAWKPTSQAARAVAAALPLLAQAREVSVITVEEAAAHGDEGDRLVRNLAWHGIKATARRVAPGADGAAALVAASGKTADLLVMGGYGHSRLREWVFGGFTQLVLDEAPLPVLMAH